MKKVLVCALLFYAVSIGQAYAHLCNDVFAQAHDNLAVKVDIRDGQLRIQDKGTFRVYILNTMDRDIANINLLVKSDAFVSKVNPSKDWQGFPVLRASKAGGKKEYFEVTLERKSGTPDGPQKIDLQLIDGSNVSRVFKAFDLKDALNTVDIPMALKVVIDGAASQEEWGKGALCTGFNEYQKVGQYQENRPAQNSPRVRLMHNGKYLYCCINLSDKPADGCADETVMLISKREDVKPIKLIFNRNKGTVLCEGASEGADAIECKANAEKDTIEARIPLSSMGIGGQKNFCVNFSRVITNPKGEKNVSYWRGNFYSVENPVVFGDCILE